MTGTKKKKAKPNRKSTRSQAVPESKVASQVVSQAEAPDIAPTQAKTEDEWRVIERQTMDMLKDGVEPATQFLDIIKSGMVSSNHIDFGGLHELYCMVNSLKSVKTPKAAVDHAFKALKYYENDDSLVRYPNTILVLISHFASVNDLSVAMKYCERGVEKFWNNIKISEKKLEIHRLLIENSMSKLNEYILLRSQAEEKKAAAAAIEKKKGKGKLEEPENKTDIRVDIETSEEVQDDDNALVVEVVAQKEKETKKFEFKAIYKMVIDEDKAKGSMWCDEIQMPMRLLQVVSDDWKNFNEYHELCASDESLLTVVHAIKHPKHPENDREHYLMIANDVYTFHEYLELLREEFLHLADQSEWAWWRLIAHRFRSIFARVVKALILLYGKQRRPYGNLHMLYITKQGRPRIQPCPESETTNMPDDVERFLVLMKQMLFSPFDPQDINEDAFNFPLELKHLLRFIPKYKGRLPAKIVLNHPFFWSISVKLKYPGKLSAAIHDSDCRSTLEKYIEADFEHWENRLPEGGLYHKIWQFGDPKNQVPEEEVKKFERSGFIKVATYKRTVSIIRYFSNVDDHANDMKYQSFRSTEKYLPSKILEDLTCLYPSFYVVVYEAVVECILELSLRDCDGLVGLKTEDSEFPAL